MTAKQRALTILNNLPEDCTEAEIAEAFSLRVIRLRKLTLSTEEQIHIGLSYVDTVKRSTDANPAEAYGEWQKMVSI